MWAELKSAALIIKDLTMIISVNYNILWEGEDNHTFATLIVNFC